MKKNSKLMIAGSILSAIISIIILVIIDQITKYYIDTNLKLYDSIPIINDILEIYYIRNSGAAWGIFKNQQILFYIITVIVLIFLCYAYFKLSVSDRYKDIKVLLVLICSGAIGNFIDRIRNQYVIDFIYFKLINFPVFNIADCYVTVGFFILIFLIIFKYKEEDFNNMFLSNKNKE